MNDTAAAILAGGDAYDDPPASQRNRRPARLGGLCGTRPKAAQRAVAASASGCFTVSQAVDSSLTVVGAGRAARKHR
ncbi:MAG: hypothetical protein M3072_06345, partial [Candidatus Dormibacteraeota bacterium]|nr:hypothetical protein [Candidatus Dormibacteraeota bacterium]